MKNIVLLVSIALLCFGCKQQEKTTEVQSTESQRPNIIFIMSDDHALQAISAYGHPISQLAPTPNIDRLANKGAIFTQNYCSNSVCGPSRAVILTGKHSHINGFRMNGDRFDGNQQTFPKLLQQAGYKTAMIGKWHLHGNPQGFDYWNILVDQGHYYNPDFITLNPNTQKADTARIHGYATDIITEDALKYLQQNRDNEKPFILMVQHKAPHRNWMPAPRHMNKYDKVKFPLPDTYFTSHKGSKNSEDQQQTIYQDMYEGHDLKMTKKKGKPELAWNPWKTDFNRMTKAQRTIWDKAYQGKNDAFHEANLSGRELAEWKGQRYLQEYLATVASVDEGVGKLLDYLDESGLAENTLVIYTSDQGFYLGEKGWFDKRFMYEESFAMPLLIQYPNHIKPKTKIEALTQNLDFAETFLDFAGVPIPADMQGKSFKNLVIQGEGETSFRDALYYHYYDYPAFHMVKKMYGVKTKRYKLFHVYDDIEQWEMYDLKTDPKELKNLYGNPQYKAIQDQLHITLDSLKKAYKVTDKEFEKTPKKQVEKAYNQFEKLRGNTGIFYDPETNTDLNFNRK